LVFIRSHGIRLGSWGTVKVMLIGLGLGLRFDRIFHIRIRSDRVHSDKPKASRLVANLETCSRS